MHQRMVETLLAVQAEIAAGRQPGGATAVVSVATCATLPRASVVVDSER